MPSKLCNNIYAFRMDGSNVILTHDGIQRSKSPKFKNKLNVVDKILQTEQYLQSLPPSQLLKSRRDLDPQYMKNVILHKPPVEKEHSKNASIFMENSSIFYEKLERTKRCTDQYLIENVAKSKIIEYQQREHDIQQFRELMLNGSLQDIDF